MKVKHYNVQTTKQFKKKYLFVLRKKKNGKKITSLRILNIIKKKKKSGQKNCIKSVKMFLISFPKHVNTHFFFFLLGVW